MSEEWCSWCEKMQSGPMYEHMWTVHHALEWMREKEELNSKLRLAEAKNVEITRQLEETTEVLSGLFELFAIPEGLRARIRTIIERTDVEEGGG